MFLKKFKWFLFLFSLNSVHLSATELTETEKEDFTRVNLSIGKKFKDLGLEAFKFYLESPKLSVKFWDVLVTLSDDERNEIFTPAIEQFCKKWSEIAVAKLEKSDISEEEKKEMNKKIENFFDEVKTGLRKIFDLQLDHVKKLDYDLFNLMPNN